MVALNARIIFTQPTRWLDVAGAFLITNAPTIARLTLQLLDAVSRYDCADIIYHGSNVVRMFYRVLAFMEELLCSYFRNKNTLSLTKTSNSVIFRFKCTSRIVITLT